MVPVLGDQNMVDKIGHSSGGSLASSQGFAVVDLMVHLAWANLESSLNFCWVAEVDGTERLHHHDKTVEHFHMLEH